MDTTRYFSVTVDRAIMKSHYETYKGWKIMVDISGSSISDDTDPKAGQYIPRIVVTEQLSIGFRELGVATEMAYPTPQRCIQGGILIARQFIDGRG